MPLIDYNTFRYMNLNAPPIAVNNNPHNINTKPDSKTLPKGSDIAIGAGIVSALAIGADFLFCKGKHIKKLFKTTSKGTTKKSNNTTVNSSQPNTGTSLKPAQAGNKVSFDGKSPINLADYTPVQLKARQFAMNEVSIYQASKNKTIDLKTYMNNQSPRFFYEQSIKIKYQNLRIASYPKTNRYIDSTMDLIQNPTSTISVLDQQGWFYRGTQNQLRQKTVDRISLNVYPDEQLIKKLDSYFSTGKVNGYYKTPESIDLWRCRHDPITIYLNEPINQNIIDDVVKMTTPHIRSTDNVLAGKTITPGIATDKSPNESDLLKIINEAEKFDPILADVLRTSTNSGFARKASIGDFNLHSSAGMVHAVKALLKDLQTAL